MDNLDDSENNAKISDSAYSNSCSNSQSRRSHSSKSTRSGSNSSGSSGYGGKPVSGPSGYSTNLSQLQQIRDKEKDVKKKKKVRIEEPIQIEKGNQCPPAPVFKTPKEECKAVAQTSPPCAGLVKSEKGTPNIEASLPESGTSKEESGSSNSKQLVSMGFVTSRRNSTNCTEGFACVISMQDGVVVYTAPSITSALGYPKEMWIGRSFMEFVHPRDCSTFASQITNGLAVPKNENELVRGGYVCSMVCRIRRYRNINKGFNIKEKSVTFMPFMLKFYYKRVNDEDGLTSYLLIHASPFYSAFKTPNEAVIEAKSFVIRHSANGSVDYIDQESIPYLGYLPQDILSKDAIQLYHPADLIQLCKIYECIVKEGTVPRSRPYRMMAQNGYYLKVETEWSSFVNPWSKKLEFVSGKHFVVEGPSNPDVFQTPEPEHMLKLSDEEKAKTQVLRHTIVRLMNEVLTKPAEAAKNKRWQDLVAFMETLIEEVPKGEDELRLEIQDADQSCCERDSVMLGGISPHHDSDDSKSSANTPISYNQLNYNETLERYFKSQEALEGDNLAMTEGKWEINDPSPINRHLPSEVGSSGDCMDSLSDSSGGEMPIIKETYHDDHKQLRLNEYLLNKHNSEMEKELVKTHRDLKSSKSERGRMSSETRKKKKEHLARCNAYYQQTSAGVSTFESQTSSSQGPKKISKAYEQLSTHRHHSESPRNRYRQALNSASLNAVTTPMAPSPWAAGHVSSLNNGYVLGVPQPIMTPLPPYPAMIPMYYTPAPVTVPSQTTMSGNTHTHQRHYQRMLGHSAGNYNRGQYHGHSHRSNYTRSADNSGAHYSASRNHVPCMMYGQTYYGQPVLYPVVDHEVYAAQQALLKPGLQNLHSLGLSNRNYEEAVGSSKLPLKNEKLRRRSRSLDKTDGESSFSSFYSSFLKTDSGSAEDSDVKNNSRGSGKKWQKKRRAGEAMSQRSLDAVNPKRRQPVKVTRMEKVCLTSELIYKYQIVTKSIEEVLARDKEKLMAYEQPLLVNEQLDQLYLDLQLEGVAARLTLEEGITSSSSSGEESSSRICKARRRKQENNKLVMIYEEDAPLPSPDDNDSSSTS